VEYFVLRLERGGPWDGNRDMREQDGWDEHAAFMDDLARSDANAIGIFRDEAAHGRNDELRTFAGGRLPALQQDRQMAAGMRHRFD